MFDGSLDDHMSVSLFIHSIVCNGSSCSIDTHYCYFIQRLMCYSIVTRSEQLKKQEEMVERQEAMRRKTAEIEAELRTRTELAKTRAEAEGRIRQERENHDLILEKVRLEAVEQRDTVLKAIADGGKLLGEGLSSYLTDGEKLRNTAFIVSLAAVGIYSAKTAAGIAGRFIEVSLLNANIRYTLVVSIT